jgi:hypothetical protein
MASNPRTEKALVATHFVRRLLYEGINYPSHGARRESPEYAKVHRDLTVTHDLPCLACGVRHSTLKDKAKNRFGAKAMETHHHIIEWALAKAISAEAFNERLLPNLKHRYPSDPQYQKAAFTQQDVEAWVDHSPHNLWVLCDVHHRAPFVGIHEVSYPAWCPQDLLADPETVFPKDLLAKWRESERAVRARRNGNGKASARTAKPR